MNLLTVLDDFAEQLEGRCASEVGEERRRGHRKNQEQKRQRRRAWMERMGFAVTGPTIGIAELLKGHLGRDIPLGENTTLYVPGGLTWVHHPFSDHNRLDFQKVIEVRIDWYLDFEAAVIAMEDWPDRLEIGIKRKALVIDEFRCPKDWSSP